MTGKRRSFVRVVQEPLHRRPVLPVGPEAAALAGPPTEPQRVGPPGARPVALFVAHGMGQQVPFETLDQVVTAIRSAHQRASVAPPDVIVRQIQMGSERVARAELTVAAKDGRARELHLYEGYWAPLTEGQISLRETMAFLISAGWAGVVRSIKGHWWRVMFDNVQKFQLTWRTVWAFAAALGAMLTLAVMNGLVATVTAARLLHGGSEGWPSGNLLVDLTVDFALCLVLVLALLGVGVGVLQSLRRPTQHGHIRPAGKGATWAGWACVYSALGVILLTGGAIAYHLIRHHARMDAVTHMLHVPPAMWAHTWLGDRFAGFEQPGAPLRQVAPMVIVWGAVALVSWLLRGFILEYVGDVAIYVSSHTVNRFWATRDAIQAAVMRVVRFVYTERDPEGDGPLYGRVIIIGHSLGSVIAYDALNAMIRDDIAQAGALEVVARTPLFVTFGSPLDKTAFIFRQQAKRMGDVRESLAEAMQPMIASYETRPRRWVNLWSRNDWISGSIDYYDDEDRRHNEPPCVENHEDPEASTPLLAHNEYWDGAALGDLLYRQVLAPDPVSVRPEG